jgi:hypothetical protein
MIGDLRVRQGDLAGGMSDLEEALALARYLDSKYEIARVLWSYAEAELAASHPGRAVHLYCAAKVILETIGVWTEYVQQEFDDKLQACRALGDESEYAVALAEGQAMTMEQAILSPLTSSSLPTNRPAPPSPPLPPSR